MLISSMCPKCQTEHELAEILAGETVNCQKCQQPFVVQAQQPDRETIALEAEPVVPTAAKRRRRRPEGGTRPRRRRRAARQEPLEIDPGLIFGLVVALVGLVLFATMLTLALTR